ncbi:MAG TPA: DUF177 domain-containing protein [Vicinamibacteria bacterium]
MFIDLDRLPLEGQAIDRTFALEGPYVEREEFRPLTPVALSGRLQPVESDGTGVPGGEGVFRLQGRMSCRIELSCVRCLEPFPMDLAEELDLLYLPQASNVAPAGEEREEDALDDVSGRGLEREELAVSFYRDERIDLSQMIVEQIVLALPMKPLCKSDCRGLCARCGANRNLASCDCSPEDSDPRWAPLKMLQKSRRS